MPKVYDFTKITYLVHELGPCHMDHVEIMYQVHVYNMEIVYLVVPKIQP